MDSPGGAKSRACHHLWSQPPDMNSFWSRRISTQDVPGCSERNVLTTSHNPCGQGVSKLSRFTCISGGGTHRFEDASQKRNSHSPPGMPLPCLCTDLASPRRHLIHGVSKINAIRVWPLCASQSYKLCLASRILQRGRTLLCMTAGFLIVFSLPAIRGSSKHQRLDGVPQSEKSMWHIRVCSVASDSGCFSPS